jgi:uncharacterized protein YndB with AHSA1/START domain
MTDLTITAEPGQLDITFTCRLPASRERVFNLVTNPGWVPHWWGPAEWTTRVDWMDVKPGGTWRLVAVDAGGQEHAFQGVYHTIEAPERLVQTSELEGRPGQVQLQTLVFEEQSSWTVLHGQGLFQSASARDQALNAGLQAGLAESLRRLERLLTQVA